jgi:uncharacterized membrane protein YeaQ/YmgE (transglycosylase-associated protein family)
MEPGTAELARTRFTGSVARAGAIAGLVGGVCGLIVEMLYGLFSGSRSFWDAPMAMWSWVFGIQHYTRNDAGGHVWPVILGIIGFLVLTAILGVVFAGIMTLARTPGDGATLVSGIVFALVVWVIVRYAIVPLNGGEDKLITTSAISSQWYWYVSWAILGLGLGASYDAERRLEPAWFELPQQQGSPLARA